MPPQIRTDCQDDRRFFVLIPLRFLPDGSASFDDDDVMAGDSPADTDWIVTMYEAMGYQACIGYYTKRGQLAEMACVFRIDKAVRHSFTSILASVAGQRLSRCIQTAIRDRLNYEADMRSMGNVN